MLRDRLPGLARGVQHGRVGGHQCGLERVEYRIGVGELEVPGKGIAAAVSGGHWDP
jgi:hypothetical protein